MLDDLLALFAIAPDYDSGRDAPRSDDHADHDARARRVWKPVLQAMRAPTWSSCTATRRRATAAALAAFYAKVPVGHVEAGLRTSTIWEPFPGRNEPEIDGPARVVSTSPRPAAPVPQLARGGECPIRATSSSRETPSSMPFSQPLRVETIAARGRGLARTRPGAALDFRDGAPARKPCEAARNLCAALAEIVALAGAAADPLWPVHPSRRRWRPSSRELLGGVPGRGARADPLPYDVTVQSIKRATLVLTDSGGLQEEAPCLGKPVLVMRDETERPEGIEAGTLELVGPHRGCDRGRHAPLTRPTTPPMRAWLAPATRTETAKLRSRVVAWLLARLRNGRPISGRNCGDGRVTAAMRLKGNARTGAILKTRNAVSQASLRAYHRSQACPWRHGRPFYLPSAPASLLCDEARRSPRVALRVTGTDLRSRECVPFDARQRTARRTPECRRSSSLAVSFA